LTATANHDPRHYPRYESLACPATGWSFYNIRPPAMKQDAPCAGEYREYGYALNDPTGWL